MDKFLNVLIMWVVTPILLLSSFYLSLRLRWPQFRKLGQAFRRVTADGGSNGRFENFSAVAVIVGGNLGAGISRGLFATDIGLGLAAIAHGEIDCGRTPLAEHALEQGIIAMLSPVIVAAICAIISVLILCAAPNFGKCAGEICVETFSIAFRSGCASFSAPFSSA